MLATRSEDLFTYMRAISSVLHGKSDIGLMECLKKYLTEEFETEATGEDGGCAAGSSSSNSGTTSFSPKKPRGPDNLSAFLACRTWLITFDCKIVTISGKALEFF